MVGQPLFKAESKSKNLEKILPFSFRGPWHFYLELD
jgi:hypothetical protein